MIAWIFRTLVLAAIGLAGWGAWLLWLAPASSDAEPADTDPPLAVTWPEPDSGPTAVGSHELVVQVTNPAARPRRIIGMMKLCGLNACAKPKFEEPVTVPPGETVAYPCVLEVSRPGPFETSIHLYLEENGIREAETVVRGVVAEPGGRNAGGKSNSGK
jgi:hypothetical protein